MSLAAVAPFPLVALPPRAFAIAVRIRRACLVRAQQMPHDARCRIGNGHEEAAMLPDSRFRIAASTLAARACSVSHITTGRQGLGDATDLPVSRGRSTRPMASAAAAGAAKLRGRREMLLQVTGVRSGDMGGISVSCTADEA